MSDIRQLTMKIFYGNSPIAQTVCFLRLSRLRHPRHWTASSKRRPVYIPRLFVSSCTALIWLLGQFGEHLDEAPYLLEDFVEHAAEQPPLVRLQLLTSCTRLFFVRSPEMQRVLGRLFQYCLGVCCRWSSHPQETTRTMT
jgi:hypothetical protein